MTIDLEVYRDIPGYKAILRSVLKSQIQLLVHQLSEHTGDETVVITANVTDYCHGYMGSSPGNKFLQQNTSVKEQFLNFCLGHHDAYCPFDQLTAPFISSQPLLSATCPFDQHPASLFITQPLSSAPCPLYQLPAFSPYPFISILPMLSASCTFDQYPALLKAAFPFDLYLSLLSASCLLVEVDASPNESRRSHSRLDPMISGQGHKVKDRGHTYDMDIEEGLRHANGSPMMDAEGEGAEIANTDIYLMTGTHNQTQEDSGNHPAVTVKTKTSIVTRSSKRKSAMPSRRY
ncbi:hypothetical protein DPMN_028707 [Dreissena polymorpha]|uniref:Uncharacterized protein n=1 Tax=Dreissena polymorpha TaxID=45954 RepID=A0A9D4RGQ2_DREPO|nr:hypothetical protein DPMN_028707 [Dreissena polymorpha]